MANRVSVGSTFSADPAPSGAVIPLPRRGRKPGSKNRRTVEIEAVLRPMVPKARKRLLAMLKGDDDELAFRAAQLCLAYVYGRPTERRELTGRDGVPLLAPTREQQLPRLVASLSVLLPEAPNNELFALAGTLLDRLEHAPAIPPGN